jgi:hypothetical protein
MSMSEYSYPFFSEEGKVNCQLCGKPFLVIAPKHLATHGVIYSEYKLRFPNAPLSCEEFEKQSKYGKEKKIFVEETLDKIEEDFEEVEVLEDPSIDEEIDLEKAFTDEVSDTGDICDKSKNKILDYLRSFYTNVRKDYMIQIFDLEKNLLFETISDFSDPVLKVNIEFPKTFWHNRDAYIKPSRKVTLQQYGWKVIEINSNSPTYEQIKTAIESS